MYRSQRWKQLYPRLQIRMYEWSVVSTEDRLVAVSSTFPFFHYTLVFLIDRLCISYFDWSIFSTVLVRGNKYHFILVWVIRLAGSFGTIERLSLNVTWSYVKRQTAKMTSEFLFFPSNLSLNHIKIEKCLLLFGTNTNIFTLLFKELKTDGKSFNFAVCRLT